jgi:hypothetical protein
VTLKTRSGNLRESWGIVGKLFSEQGAQKWRYTSGIRAGFSPQVFETKREFCWLRGTATLRTCSGYLSDWSWLQRFEGMAVQPAVRENLPGSTSKAHPYRRANSPILVSPCRLERVCCFRRPCFRAAVLNECDGAPRSRNVGLTGVGSRRCRAALRSRGHLKASAQSIARSSDPGTSSALA